MNNERQLASRIRGLSWYLHPDHWRHHDHFAIIRFVTGVYYFSVSLSPLTRLLFQRRTSDPNALISFTPVGSVTRLQGLRSNISPRNWNRYTSRLDRMSMNTNCRSRTSICWLSKCDSNHMEDSRWWCSQGSWIYLPVPFPQWIARPWPFWGSNSPQSCNIEPLRKIPKSQWIGGPRSFILASDIICELPLYLVCAPNSISW